MGRRVHGNSKKICQPNFFTIVFVLCMLSAFNCGRLQGSENDFDKVANGIEAKLAAFKQKFKNIFAQKNLTEEQQHKVLGNLGKNFYEIVENANKKWKSFQGQLKKADNSTREHMMKKFHEITEKVHEIEDIGEDEEEERRPRGKGKGPRRNATDGDDDEEERRPRGKGKGPRRMRQGREEEDDDRRPPRRNSTEGNDDEEERRPRGKGKGPRRNATDGDDDEEERRPRGKGKGSRRNATDGDDDEEERRPRGKGKGPRRMRQGREEED